MHACILCANILHALNDGFDNRRNMSPYKTEVSTFRH